MPWALGRWQTIQAWSLLKGQPHSSSTIYTNRSNVLRLGVTYNQDREKLLGNTDSTQISSVSFVDSPNVAFLSMSDTYEVHPVFQD